MASQCVSWNLIRHLNSQHQIPWFIGGDFNEILRLSEKTGRRSHAQSQMDGFNEVLAECSLTDIGFQGYPYTWSNNREAPSTIRCRLDLICANGAGLQMYSSPMVTHLPFGGLDHCPLLLRLTQSNHMPQLGLARPFRFESIWVSKKECEDIIKENNGSLQASFERG